MGLKVHESLFNTRHLIDKLCDQMDIYATYKDLLSRLIFFKVY